MPQLPYISHENSCTVFIDGTPYTFYKSDVDWAEVAKILNQDDPDTERLKSLIDVKSVYEQAISDINDEKLCTRVELVDGEILFDGLKVDNVLSRRMYEIMRDGLDVTRWLAFAEKVYANPLESARAELLLWIEESEMPITEDGNFLAFKKVNKNYRDIYTGTFDNSVGSVVQMDRSKVDTNRYNLCSTGLHFCSKDYLQSYGSSTDCRIMVVEINPADVVSIPADYNNAKGRTWRYHVVDEVPDQTFAQTKKLPSVVSVNDLEWQDDEKMEDWELELIDDSVSEDFVADIASEALESMGVTDPTTGTESWAQRIWKRLLG